MQQQPIEANQQSQTGVTPPGGEDSCTLTTFDRDTGMAHDVVMRFAFHEDCIYMLSDEGGEAHWVQNLLRNPEVSLQVGPEKVAGMARAIAGGYEAQMARQTLAAKYEGWHDGQPLSEWARNSLPVAIDLAPGRHSHMSDDGSSA